MQVEILIQWRYVSIIVARRMTHKNLTGSEIISHEIDPVLFIASHRWKIPGSNGTSGMFMYRADTCAVNNWLVKLVLPPPIHTAPIQVSQSLCSLSVPVAEHAAGS